MILAWQKGTWAKKKKKATNFLRPVFGIEFIPENIPQVHTSSAYRILGVNVA